MIHCLVDLYKSCSKYSPVIKIGPAAGSLIPLYTYSENLKGHLKLLTQVSELGPNGPLVQIILVKIFYSIGSMRKHVY